MATKTDPDQDRYNPGSKHYDDLTGGDQRPGTTDMSGFENRGVMSQDDLDNSRQGFYKPNSSADDTKRNASQAEKQAVGDTVAGKAATAAATGVNATLGQAVKMLGKIKTKKGGITAGVISLIMIAIVGIGAFYSLSLAPIAFFTNIMDDLNDSVAALDDHNTKIFRNKVPFDDQDRVMKGCRTKMSIRCKYRSLSKTDVAKLKGAGIDVEGRTIGGRTFPKAYKVGDQSFSPREMAKAIRTDPDMAGRFRTAFNMKFLSTVSGKFKAVLAKFRTSAKAATVTGKDGEERFKNLAKTGYKEPISPNAKFVKAGMDEDGNQLWKIEGQEDGRVFTDSQKNFSESIRDFGKTGFGGKFLKSVSVTGWADTACSFKNMLGFTAQMGKIYQKRHLIQAALPIIALAFKIKAGEATPADAEAAGEYFTRADNRQMVDDLQKSVTENPDMFDKDGIESGKDITVAQKSNPYQGKNATDGNLAQLSMHGGPFKPTETSLKYSLSMSGSSLVTALAGTAAVLTAITSIGTGSDKCDLIQSWWARGIGLITGIFAAFGSAGTTVAFNLVVMGVIAVGMMILQEKLISMVSGSPVPPDIDQKPEDRQAIQWTGTAAVMDEAAMRNGLIPGTPEDIIAYQQRSLPIKQKYIALEAKDSAWNDLSTPYSLLGRLVTMKDQFKPDQLTIPDTIAGVSNLLASAREQVVNPSAYAQSIDKDRLSHCDDDIYKKAGPGGRAIAVDVQCNVRYHVPLGVSRLDADEVAAYMEDNGYVPEQTTDGMPLGYTPPSENDSSNFVDSIVSGAINSFYNTRSSMYRASGKTNQYAIYLDYCVYRNMPWGETYEESGAFGSVKKGWIDGSNCMLKDGQRGDGINGSVVKYFQAYTINNSAMGINDEYTPPASYTTETEGAVADQPPNTVSHGAMGWDLKDNTDYYDKYPCEGGMADEGKYTHPTRGFSIRLCRSPGGDDVASLISGRLSVIMKKAKDQGMNLTAYSGFRTYQEQQSLYAANCSGGTCNPPTAVPGESNHEQGLSVDFALDGSTICFPRATCNPGENKAYDFLVKEAGDYGFLKHPREAWHWGTRTYP